MDPIYHYLNRIPRVISVQGYIDDNTIAGPGHDIAWVGRVHYCYQCCSTAGFQIDQHSCWQAISAECPPFSVQRVADHSEHFATKRLPTFPTARAAILAAVLPQKTLILIRADKCPTRQQLCPGESKLLFGLTGMTPKISFCSWPMPRNSKKPSGISTRFVPSCSIQYHWRDSSAHKTIEPFNLQRAAFKVYTSELKHSPMFWSKP